MENGVKCICCFVSDCVKLETAIKQNKLSSGEIKALLQLVDVKGKGFLDLSDVYDLIGKVTEEQLFAVFKFLDVHKTGQIGEQELLVTLGDARLTSNNTSKQYIFPRFYAMVDSVKDRPKVIKQAKEKLSLSGQQLKQIYSYLCQQVKSKYLTFAEFVTEIKGQSRKFGIAWDEDHENVLAQLLPGLSVTENKFIECFSAHLTQSPQEENLLSTFGSVSPPQKLKMTKQEAIKPLTLLNSEIDSQNPSIIYKKLNNFMDHSQPPSFRAPSPMNNSGPARKQFDHIEGNIKEVLGAIQQRREKLRNDSLERKKLIEDVMNRKKELCLNRQGSSPKDSRWAPQDKDYLASYNSYKPEVRSYLNKTSTAWQPSSPKQSSIFILAQINDKYNYPSKPTTDPYYDLGFQAYNHNKTPAFPTTDQDIVTPSAAKQKFRPSTPNASSQLSFEINDILKKYNQNKESRIDEESTLRQLCKSKSGLIGSGTTGFAHFPTKYSEFTDPYERAREGLGFESKGRVASKENMMRRAEQEAAKKIEEIERKARMKVLEKKSMFGRQQNKEWRGIKKGTFY